MGANTSTLYLQIYTSDLKNAFDIFFLIRIEKFWMFLKVLYVLFNFWITPWLANSGGKMFAHIFSCPEQL